jgi:hypothetical protein
VPLLSLLPVLPSVAGAGSVVAEPPSVPSLPDPL